MSGSPLPSNPKGTTDAAQHPTLRGIRLVALDLDGTLLPSDKKLTDRAKRVVSDMKASGIHVVLATGRGWTHAAEYAGQLGLNAPHVTFEGALVAENLADGGVRVLHRKILPSDLIRRVNAAVHDLGVGWFCCADDGHTKASHHLGDRIDQVRIWDPNVTVHPHWPHEADHGYVLHLVGPPSAVKAARERVHALGLDDIDHWEAEFWDGFDQLQLRPGGIGKHAGLAHVLADLGLGPHEMLAAGDWWNDVEMLTMAGVALCPENAVDGVKAVADHVAPGTSDDDAVIRWLERALARG